MPRYLVDIHYQTDSGNAGCARAFVRAKDEDDAFDMAERKARADKRRRIMKIHAGDCVAV